MSITSHERVLRACHFERPDRIPRFDSFWELPPAWERRLGPPESLSDIAIWCPREGAFPTRAKLLERRGDWTVRVDDWGRTVRSRDGAYFDEVLEVPIPPGCDPEHIVFDAPCLDLRYAIHGGDLQATASKLAADKSNYCVFGKTGGPYLRTSFVRGTEQFLMDMAGDVCLARALVDKMVDHLIAVGVELLRRWDLSDSGVWIYDDMAHNGGPMFSPDSFERVLLPAYRRMIRAYKEAGARYVVLHSDGNILPILDMLVDAGIDGLNPLERRTGMIAEQLRRRYPQLILTGGMCNTQTLPLGSAAEIESEAKTLIELGRDGGFIIGTHSVSPEIPLESFATYQRTCETHGDFTDAAPEDQAAGSVVRKARE
ncbi:MAG: hypothetical protein HOM68_05095 [Gemmatimonadetes bacterium]|jgi:hypothetical protein|nr:hypothetical protein [Gemmatimonadota bacterium]MBT5055897.1 hypothetical protein [Gemmatimonadota bacterium]MBT5141566.1 hypothetical protein [Gemmatimonadota bacterium]MBT5590869.1 hypothetical protein [Gemmatimonadota bacterium]MBT5965067.1 hypothetical protein [Gemmatimonadota bacterium]